MEKAVKAVEGIGGRLIPIGRVIEEKLIKVRWADGWRVLERRGHQHF